ncbi:hypothetical protein [Aeromicrobium sp. UC242_57]|uniref:hypothetical protein n=1 Tax=Aeromicrobium sp. UC242_57 TaxID=3374624 RepID=UPI0037955E6A
MRLRTPAIIAALLALVVSLLSALPAEAASYSASVKTTRIALSASGTGQIPVRCSHKKKSCKGKISFRDDTGTPRARSYSIRPGKTANVTVSIHTNAADNPHNAPATPGRDIKSVKNVRLKVAETSPRRTTHYYNSMTTETRLTRQDITGTVTGIGGSLVSDVRVDLLRSVRGGNVVVVKGQDVPNNGGRFRLGVSLGANNASSSPYRLRVSGTDAQGVRRSWFWRGTDNRPSGGGAHLRDGSVIRASRLSDFDANFTYGKISGTTAAGAEVTVASPPPSFSGGSTTLRELDITRCANIFGQTKANSSGGYVVQFLPLTATSSNRYMVGVKNGSTQAWYGRTNTRYGSCYDITNYRYKKTNLITLTAPLVKSLNASSSDNRVTVKARYSKAYKPTQQGDRWIRLREKIPGTRVLDSRVVAEGFASAGSKSRTFNNVAPGDYWVEVGRRTGCSDWYPSKFPNNRAYFKGSDRSAERWKSFKRLKDLSGGKNSGNEARARRADPNPATDAQNKIKRGYAGWMYRGYCKAHGAGTVNTVRVSGTGQRITKTTSTNRQGAVVKGRVSRTKGRTNKEIMVRLSSSAGTRVIRTDITDGSGTFYIAGLASGKWTISVNSDSWRGIGRKFTGRKSVTVRAGKGYNVGTLRFNG